MFFAQGLLSSQPHLSSAERFILPREGKEVRAERGQEELGQGKDGTQAGHSKRLVSRIGKEQE